MHKRMNGAAEGELASTFIFALMKTNRRQVISIMLMQEVELDWNLRRGRGIDIPLRHAPSDVCVCLATTLFGISMWHGHGRTQSQRKWCHFCHHRIRHSASRSHAIQHD